jgi:hypothetical protein
MHENFFTPNGHPSESPSSFFACYLPPLHFQRLTLGRRRERLAATLQREAEIEEEEMNEADRVSGLERN